MRSIFAVAAGLLAAVAAFAADPLPRAAPESVGMSSARLARIAPVLNDEIQKGRMPGAVLAIARRGKRRVHKLYPASSSPAGQQMSAQEFLDRVASLPLLHQPGSTWDYGFGLDVLGLVIEKLSGQTLGRFLDAQLFKPLGMVDTGFLVPPEKLKRYARGLANDPVTGKPQFWLDLSKPLKFECGGGCAASTAADYLRFVQMLLNGGRLDGKRVLGRKSVEYMTSNQLAPGVVNLVGGADPSSADMGFGLGVAVRTTPGIVRKLGSVGEFAWNGAYGTS